MKIELNEHAGYVFFEIILFITIIILLFILRGCVQDDYKHAEQMKELELKYKVEKGVNEK